MIRLNNALEDLKQKVLFEIYEKERLEQRCRDLVDELSYAKKLQSLQSHSLYESCEMIRGNIITELYTAIYHKEEIPRSIGTITAFNDLKQEIAYRKDIMKERGLELATMSPISIARRISIIARASVSTQTTKVLMEVDSTHTKLTNKNSVVNEKPISTFKEPLNATRSPITEAKKSELHIAVSEDFFTAKDKIICHNNNLYDENEEVELKKTCNFLVSEIANNQMEKRALKLNQSIYKPSDKFDLTYTKPASTKFANRGMCLRTTEAYARRKSISTNKRKAGLADVIHTKQILIEKNSKPVIRKSRTSNSIHKLSETFNGFENVLRDPVMGKLKRIVASKFPLVTVANSCNNLYSKQTKKLRLSKRKYELPINISSLTISNGRNIIYNLT